MVVYILNANFERIGIIDTFKSLIWTDRAREYGDFELSCFPTEKNIQDCSPDNFVENPESEHLMIIEKIDLKSDTDDGDEFIVAGNSLESILERRIVWTKTVLSGSLQEGIKKLINEAIISPEIAERKIPNFVFEDSTDTAITTLMLSKECEAGDNLYDIIKDVCDEYKICFKVVLNSEKKLTFSLYAGADRSYTQSDNAFVMFSPNFENIITSEYSSYRTDYKNVCLVTASRTKEGAEEETEYTEVAGTGEGITRREMHVEGSDVPTKNDHEVEYSDAEYKNLLAQRGLKELGDNPIDEKFEGEVDYTNVFVYGKDFFLGDTIQVANAYGMEGPSYVKEVIWSEDTSGTKCYPTFESEKASTIGDLFYNGDQCRQVTGGWTIYDPNEAKYKFEIGNILRLQPEDTSGAEWNRASAWFVTSKKVDLSKWNRLQADIIGNGRIYIVENSQSPATTETSKPVKDVFISIAGGGHTEIDISDLNGSYYIGFGPWATPNYVEAFHIWTNI